MKLHITHNLIVALFAIFGAAILAVLIFQARKTLVRGALWKKLTASGACDDPRCGKRYGKYRVIDRIGEGNMSIVYRAIPLDAAGVDDVVALKIMVPESSPDQPRLVERFRREVSICTELSHPNILQVFGYGQTGGELYLAMENLVGNTMREWIGDTGMPIEHFASLFRQACGALGYAHDRGIVHRDIKPENIMVLSDGTVKIMDFGLAKGFLHSGLTMKGFTVGTPAYMAPEQIMSKGLDHRTDQYSLGVVAFEMITGRLPFVDEDVTQMMMMHIEAETPSPRLYRPDLSPALEEMILRMLEKEPTRRFYDMREVLRALDAAFAY